MHDPKEACLVLLTTCSDSKPDEKILIVTDEQAYPIAKILWEAANDYPEKSMIMMDKRAMHGKEPTKLVAGAMKDADVIFGATTYSLYHTQARRDASANGARFVNMVDYSIAQMSDGGLYADIKHQGKVNDILAKDMVGNIARVTSALGTNLVAEITGRPTSPQYARSITAGSASSPPNVECAIAPLETKINGVIYVDGSIPHPALGLIDEPIRLDINDGKITKISGGRQAEILEEVLASFGDPNAYVLGEIGVGMNPLCKLNGNMLDDEGCYGTVHFGFGSNISFGGINKCASHLDMVIREPIFTVDDKIIVDKGVIPAQEIVDNQK